MRIGSVTHLSYAIDRVGIHVGGYTKVMKPVVCAALVLAALTTPGTMWGQGLLGSILGNVTDAKGASVGDVAVTAISRDTNLQVSAITQANGLYQIPNLPIGLYSVSFKKAGFEVENHPQILVQAERAATVNAALKVGAVSSTVEVTGTPLLNETDATNGYVLDANTIREIPLATGSFTQLALLSPGVNADFLSGTGSNGGLGNQDIWANGQRDTSNSIVVDGVNADNLFNGKTGSGVASSRFTANTGQSSTVGGQSITSVSVYDAIGQALPSPPQESLEEIRVNTAMYDATQGARSGAHISAITKSGTNSYHGEVYEYFQNTIFNAAPFFRNAAPVSLAIPAGQRVPPLHYNRPGGTFGGPIIKNKLFFFGSFQALRVTDNLAGSSTATVPQHLTIDRSAAALVSVAQQDLGVTIAQSQIDPAALKILNLKVNGSYFIPSPNITDPAAANATGLQRSGERQPQHQCSQHRYRQHGLQLERQRTTEREGAVSGFAELQSFRRRYSNSGVRQISQFRRRLGLDRQHLDFEAQFDLGE